MHAHIIESVLLKKKILSQVTAKQNKFFSMNDIFQNTLIPNWEIQTDWENNV